MTEHNNEPADSNGTADSIESCRVEAEDANSRQTRETGRKRWLWAIIAALVAAALLIAGVLSARDSRSGDQNVSVGETGTVEETSISESPSAEPSETEPVPSEGNYVDPSGEQSAEVQPAPGQFEGFDGMSLTVAGQTAVVDPIQLTTSGMLIPPTDVSRLGWYSASAVPGAEGNSGSTVITGHINYQGQGSGFASNFTQLGLGDEFTIAIDGQPQAFRVVQAPFRVPKGTDMPSVVNDSTGTNKVVLITCGGKFVGGKLGYEDNIFTVAEPV